MARFVFQSTSYLHHIYIKPYPFGRMSHAFPVSGLRRSIPSSLHLRHHTMEPRHQRRSALNSDVVHTIASSPGNHISIFSAATGIYRLFFSLSLSRFLGLFRTRSRMLLPTHFLSLSPPFSLSLFILSRTPLPRAGVNCANVPQQTQKGLAASYVDTASYHLAQVACSASSLRRSSSLNVCEHKKTSECENGGTRGTIHTQA